MPFLPMAGLDRSVRFENFRFDPDTGELVRDDALVVRLQEQPSRVLEALMSSAGRLVTREELHKLLWPENSLVDADNGLNIAINKIRLALNDSATDPEFIQTVPRRGYKFIAAIHPAQPAATQEGPVEAIQSRGFRLLRPAFAVAVAMVLLVFGAWRFGPMTPAIHSVAVVPFVNLSGDPSLDYAVTGLTDTLATELASRGLSRVISTDATAHFKNSNASPAEISRELHSDVLVLGAVARDGASYAVNIRLVEGSSGRNLWAAKFVRATAMEISFSDDLLDGLAPALGLASAPARVMQPPVSTSARNEYLRGRYFWNKRGLDAIEKSVGFFTGAISAEPQYALAWVGLAQAYVVGAETPSAVIQPWPGNGIDAGIEAARRALQIDPALGEAHAALGRLRMRQWRWGDAERELAEAVRLSPNDATTRQWYGTLLSRLQKCPNAIDQALVGAEIDPISAIVNEAVGVTYSACRQPERAVPVFRKALAMHPDFPSTHMRLAGAYLRLGDAAAALAEYREAQRLRPDNCEIQARMIRALIDVGNLAEAQSLAVRIVANETSDQGSMLCVAIARANTGDRDGAFGALEAAVARRGAIDGILSDFHLHELHDDPRWNEILDKVGLTPYARAAAQRR